MSKKDGIYHNAPIAQAFLVEGTPARLGEGVMHQAAMSERAFKDLPKLILEYPPSPASNHEMVSEKKWAEKALWIARNQRAGMARQMSGIVAVDGPPRTCDATLIWRY